MRGLIAFIVAMTAAGSAHADALDDVFKAFAKPDAPGCTVGVSRKGQPAILRAYGAAEVEHGVANRVDTIFEAGSVSKQFTAAAVLTLVRDGKLALSDDIRKHLPEMPSYGATITIDHLLNHTSGLRDWGEVAGIAGWPRGARVHDNEEALRIASRQKALNYPTGQAFSYTNTGYNLLPIIVERVSGQSFAAFSRERLFTPLGMTRTQWRDNFRRVVPGRAQAYMPSAGGMTMAMPFENVHGNGGLLTTADDLLTWSAAIEGGKLGALVTARLHEQGVLTNGRKIAYARGLFIQTYKGHREVAHDGATGGYRAFLGRYPGFGLSVAVLCNAGNAAPTGLGHQVADLYLPGGEGPKIPTIIAAPTPPSGPGPTAEELRARPGIYVQNGPLNIVRVAAEGGHLRLQGGAYLEPQGPGAYKAGSLNVTFKPDGRMELLSPGGEPRVLDRGEAGRPTAAELTAIAGTYVSDEADATLVLSVKGDQLIIAPSDRPSAAAPLRLISRDAFTGPGYMVRPLKDRAGKVTGLRFIGGRVYDLRFRKVS